MVKRIQKIFEEPFSLVTEIGGVKKNHEIFIGASIGVAMYPDHGEAADALLMNADAAMYVAKRGGKNTCRFYLDEMNDRALEQIDMESLLRRALQKSELYINYQPQVDLLTGRIVCVEALLRWESPELGAVDPAKFIRLAENTGQIIAISEWVLETVCKQLKQWQEQGLSGFRVAVNLSSLHYHFGQLETQVGKVLKENEIAPEYLELELTESIMMRDVDRGVATLDALREMGVRISIDDFGKGYSSLTYLQSFPIDVLKIDRSFVQKVGKDKSSEALLDAIISMGNSLGFSVVAEGVENLDQLEFLLQTNCNCVQGFLLGRPMDADQMYKYIKKFDLNALQPPQKLEAQLS